MKSTDAIKETSVRQGFSQPVKNYEEKLIDVGTKVRYLYEPGELEARIRGQQYGPKLKIDTLKSISQHFITEMMVLNDLLFLKSFNQLRIPSYLIPYVI